MTPNREQFLQAVFKGDRFEDHELPVDLLQELASYQTILVRVAKHLYLQKNTSRSRVPNGFAKELGLKLTRIDSGSAVAVLSRSSGGDYQEFLQEAQAVVLASIDHANNGEELPEGFPSNLLGGFNTFGKNLEGSEHMELRSGQSGNGHIYSLKTRQALTRGLTERPEIHYAGYVRVTGATRKPKLAATFELPDGRSITSPYEDEETEAIIEGLKLLDDRWVRIEGTARIDSDSRVQELSELVDASVVDDLPSKIFDLVLQRLTELENLTAGWFDGEGVGIAGNDLGWVRNLAVMLVGELGNSQPGVFPTPEGDVQIELKKGNAALTLRFFLGTRQLDVRVLCLATGQGVTGLFEEGDGPAILRFIESKLANPKKAE